MRYDARLEALRTKHSDLEVALEMEEKRPLPDVAALQELKRQKLRIKDEIKRIVLQ